MSASKVSERSVRRQADPQSFQRGQAYFEARKVHGLAVDGTTVTAAVHGTSDYRVRLDIVSTGLDGRCSCPYGETGVFCKHCVAVALAWLAEGGEVGEPRLPAVTDDRLREFLLAKDPAWLVDTLLAAAGQDPILRAGLDVAAGADMRAAYDDRPQRTRLVRAIEVGEDDYREGQAYSRDVCAELDAVAELVDRGFPDVAVTLAEYALELLEDAGGYVDSSDGGLLDAIARAEEVHFEACSAGAPDPIQLAERLARTALTSNFEVFVTALPDYAPMLGPTGLARYRELVEEAWHTLPPKARYGYDHRRPVVTFLLERVADCAGGTDAVIGVLAHEVVDAADVLRIAEKLRETDRDDEALDWLRRGMAEFPPDWRLRALAADCHLRAGHSEEAAELLWANFADRPRLPGYIALHDATAEKFPTWRDRALAMLRKSPADTDLVVEILLWEGKADAAWETAADLDRNSGLLLRAARARAATHPADAIPVVLAAADQLVGGGNRDAYRHAARVLKEAETLFARCDRQEDFPPHLAALRTRHRLKRALREELDRAHLP